MLARIVLADAHAMFRDGLRVWLEGGALARVVAEAGGGDEALEAIEKHAPDAAVLDLALDGGRGSEVIQRVVEAGPGPPCIALASSPERRDFERASRAGARGFAVKTRGIEELADAIATVSTGGVFVSPELADQAIRGLVDPAACAGTVAGALSRRELDVLRRIAEGDSVQEIAGRLDISTSTVQAHRIRMMKKLGIHKLAHLVRFAVREGLVPA